MLDVRVRCRAAGPRWSRFPPPITAGPSPAARPTTRRRPSGPGPSCCPSIAPISADALCRAARRRPREAPFRPAAAQHAAQCRRSARSRALRGAGRARSPRSSASPSVASLRRSPGRRSGGRISRGASLGDRGCCSRRSSTARRHSLSRRPVQRGVSIGEVATRNAPSRDGSSQSAPASAVRTRTRSNLLVLIARIERRRDAGGGADLLELGATPAEQRPHQPDMGSRSDRPGPHPGEATHARAAGQAHQYGFGLIVGVMGGDERVEPALLAPNSRATDSVRAAPAPGSRSRASLQRAVRIAWGTPSCAQIPRPTISASARLPARSA